MQKDSDSCRDCSWMYCTNSLLGGASTNHEESAESRNGSIPKLLRNNQGKKLTISWVFWFGRPVFWTGVRLNQTEKLRPKQLGKHKTPGLLAADLRPLLPGLGLVRPGYSSLNFMNASNRAGTLENEATSNWPTAKRSALWRTLIYSNTLQRALFQHAAPQVAELAVLRWCAEVVWSSRPASDGFAARSIRATNATRLFLALPEGIFQLQLHNGVSQCCVFVCVYGFYILMQIPILSGSLFDWITALQGDWITDLIDFSQRNRHLPTLPKSGPWRVRAERAAAKKTRHG